MRTVSGYISLYLSATMFAVVTLLVRISSRYYDSAFMSASRFAIGAIICLAVLYFGYGTVKPVKPGLLVFRGAFGALSMVAGYAAIALSGPGRATVLSNTYPLFVAVFGALFFGERFRIRTLGSIALCLAGAVLIARDGSGASLAGDLLAVVSSLSAGMAVNIIRRASAYENPFMIYLSPCLFGLPLFFFVNPAVQVTAGGLAGLALLLAIGSGAVIAQALMGHGYKTVSAGAGSVVFYWETVLTVILAVLFTGESANARFIAGLVIIMVGLRVNQGSGPRAKDVKNRAD
ncbi:MAG: DMT family transporter [Treponemataceae bacterium]